MENLFNKYSPKDLETAHKHIADLIWRNRKYGYLKGMESELQKRKQQIEEAQKSVYAKS